MKYIDEFREPALTKGLAKAIKAISTKPVRFMELCGTHTMAIARYGLIHMLPSTVELVSGPGCPVCVTAIEEIDRVIELAQLPGVIVATFGDLMRVPGSSSSLAKVRAIGGQVKVVYSVLDAIELALANPYQQIVFFAIGFETTAPTVAAAILMAYDKNISNFTVLPAHKLLPAAINSLLAVSTHGLDGFLCPGHVTTIIGTTPYEIIARDYHLPCVISGFEPADILGAIFMLVKQIEVGRAEVENQYTRGVNPIGNLRAQALIERVFITADVIWRGLGQIPMSGLELAPAFLDFDARVRFNLQVKPAIDNQLACQCGDILRGLARPTDCKFFNQICKPENPLGPCMVSTEGSCAAWYKYRKD